MIFGIGTDIVEICRFDKFVREANISLLDRIFTKRERQYCDIRRSSGQHYALRFAAKEAFLKALGTGLRDGMAWRQIEVVNDRLGKPELLLSGKAAEIFGRQGLTKAFLSLSHDGGYATAMVVLEKSS